MSRRHLDGSGGQCSSVGRMCACHDPLVFGHRCKDEPSGDYYTSPVMEATMMDLDHELSAVLNALASLDSKLTV